MNWIRERVLAGELISGVFLSLGSPYIAELACRAGLDWILIDTEHGLGDDNALVAQVRASALTTTAPIVRVAANRPEYFKRALDIGAAGIMVPQVNSAEEARKAVQSMRYPPDGMRGMTRSSMAADFGYGIGAYLEDANENVLTIIQIETKDAIANIEDIAAVDGVDVLFVGPTDLSCSLGVPCDLENGVLCSTIDQVQQTARKHGKRTGILVKDASQVSSVTASGFTVVAMQTDTGIVRSGMQLVAETVNSHKQNTP